MTSTHGAARASLSRRRLLRAGVTTGVALLAGPAISHGGAEAAPPVRRIRALRTPEHRFAGLDGFPFQPRYVRVNARTRLRMHYIDARPHPFRASGETVLLLHGEPSWSYLYRHVIEPMVAAGHRVNALGNVSSSQSRKIDPLRWSVAAGAVLFGEEFAALAGAVGVAG